MFFPEVNATFAPLFAITFEFYGLNLRRTLQQDFKQLKESTTSLLKEVTDHSIVRQLFRAVSRLSVNDFVLSKGEYMIVSDKNQTLLDVEQLLSELKKEFPTQSDEEQDLPSHDGAGI